MALWLSLVLLLIPLAIAPGWFFYFDVTPKTVVLLLGTAAAAVWWTRSAGGRVPRWFSALLCAMAFSLAVSTAISVHPALSLGGTNWRFLGLIPQLAVLGFAWLVAACCAGDPARVLMVLRGVVTGGLLTAAYGIAQYFGYDPLLDSRVYHVGEGVWTIVRPPATLGHADYFGIWMLFVVFAGVALAGADPEAKPAKTKRPAAKPTPAPVSRFWKRMGQAAVGLSSVAIVLSGTRAAMVGLAAGAIVLMLWRGYRVTRRLLTAAALVTLAGAVFYFSPAGTLLRARVHWVLTEPTGGARFLLWRDSLRIALGRWPTGYGPETFTATFALHKSAELSRSFPEFYYESPHNILLDLLVSQGIPGVLLLAALCAGAFAAAWKVRREPLAGVLAAGLAAMTLGGLFVCFTMPTALAYFVTMACIVSLTAAPAPAINRFARMAAAIPFAVVLVVAAALLTLSETSLAAVRRDLASGSIAEAAKDYAGIPRGGPGADLWYSRRLVQIAGGAGDRELRVQAFQNAVTAAQKATQTDDAPFNAYYNLAAVYASQNDSVHTEACLRSAIACSPNWFKPRWMLAQVLAAGGHLLEAQQEAARAVELDGGKHPEVASTLDRIRAQIHTEPQH